MNPFNAFQEIKDQYKSYIQTFQIFKDPDIGAFIQDHIDSGEIICREPIIQILKKFKQGRSLDEYVNEGLLHNKCLDIFRARDAVIHPYYHQEEAFDVVLKKRENLIVTTGTASGKSLCFEVPIINECLKMAEDNKQGVKAIIVYPMNALANSQYYELAKRLAGSGVKIGLYTGDTKVDPENALKNYREIFGDDATPSDAEVISRKEMHNNPPDILITNYVQLELLLTRLEDRKLFAESHKRNLKYLVIDELHTYRGKKATDVAFLIRRLKQRTDTIGNLICIGTSATMVSEKESENPEETVAAFATKYFGEEFKPENVIKETEDETLYFDGYILPTTFNVREDYLDSYDENNINTAVPLYEAVMGESFNEDVSENNLGEKLKRSKLLSFIEKELSEDAKGFSDLVDSYHSQLRQTLSKEQAAMEIQAGILLGMSGRIISDTGISTPRFITKVHTFFNQGNDLRSCLHEECRYISSQGETTCPKCMEEARGESLLYPYHFCRICGQEYYGVNLTNLHKIAIPWSMFDNEYEAGVQGYFAPWTTMQIPQDLPTDWLTPKRGDIKQKYKDRAPLYLYINPENGKYSSYIEGEALQGIFVPYPFSLCIKCGTEHSRQVSEYTKLFLLNSIGRATGTNVLSAAIINTANEKERKLIAFTDNLQDSAFQSGHFNDWYNQIYFRRALYQVLKEQGGKVLIKELPKFLLEKLIGNNRPRDPRSRIFERYYLRYLETYLFVEIRGTKKFTSQNLEDVGLVEIEYDFLEEYLQEENALQNYPYLKTVEKRKLYEFLIGFLDIFRMEVAVNQNDLINKESFRQEVIKYLEDNYPERRIFEAFEETKPGGFTDGNSNDIKYKYNPHALSTSRRFASWINKVFGDQNDDTIFNETLKFFTKNGYLIELTENRQNVVLVSPEFISLKESEQDYSKVCPRCDSKYKWHKLDYCIMLQCKDSLVPYEPRHNYYYQQYTQPIDSDRIIRAANHSSMVKGQERKIRENEFKYGKLQLLVSTPTMELGIDIGTLSSIYMRNVPPNPSNYVQRAGRAGRSGQGSIISTFCGSGPGRGSHDQFFYNHPMEMVSGKISMPRFNLDNAKLFMAHVNSLILQTIDEKLYPSPSQMLDFGDESNNLPMFQSYIDTLQNSIQANREKILEGIYTAFRHEIETSEGEISKEDIINQIVGFVDNLNKAFDKLRSDYLESVREINNLDIIIRRENQADNTTHQIRRTALENRNQNIKAGEDDFYTYRYLSQVGFLPNYAFPIMTSQLRFLHKKQEESISRDHLIALREYAPLNTVYYEGQKYVVENVSREVNLDVMEDFIICDSCGFIEKLRTREIRPTNCSFCGDTMDTVHPVKALYFPRMRARRRMRINSEEEERAKSGYDIRHSYRSTNKIRINNLITNNEKFGQFTFERSATMYHLNLGAKADEPEGFILNTESGIWLSKNQLDEQNGEEIRNRRNLLTGIRLYVQSENDVITVSSTKYYGEQEEEIALTLLHVMLQAISYTLNLDDGEISGFVQPIKEKPSRIVIFEYSEGGTGTLASIIDNIDLIKRIATRGLEIIHCDNNGNDSSDACEKACYNCICNYYNQIHHKKFDRTLVKDYLLNMISLTEIKRDDSQDHKFRALTEQCSTELERKVLGTIYDRGLRLPDEIHKIISKDGSPIAEIDFFYSPRYCVMIDGPDHDNEHVQRDDEEKRRKLKLNGYQVVSVYYRDDDEEIVEKLKIING